MSNFIYSLTFVEYAKKFRFKWLSLSHDNQEVVLVQFTSFVWFSILLLKGLAETTCQGRKQFKRLTSCSLVASLSVHFMSLFSRQIVI